jgi:hypothetical protein
MNVAIIWFNLDLYTLMQIILFLSGAAFWIINYIFIIRNIIKNKFVEMPGAVLCANVTWELLWGFVFVPDMGFAVSLGYKIWFLLDVFIVVSFYRYGYKQVNQSVIPYHKLFFTFGLFAWLILTYFFVKQGLDNPIGANSAYLSNILISLLYIFMFLRLSDKSVLSFTTAWTKWLGTGLITIMCIIKWPYNYWMICMGLICFLLDIFYIFLLLKEEKKNLIKG